MMARTKTKTMITVTPRPAELTEEIEAKAIDELYASRDRGENMHDAGRSVAAVVAPLAAEQALKGYKRRVRRLAIRAMEDEHWCLESLNDALEELDLAHYHGRVSHHGTARIIGEAGIAVNRPADLVLTAGNITEYVSLYSNDVDVHMVGDPKVISYEPTGDGGGTLAMDVPVVVTKAGYLDAAESWVRQALHFQWTGKRPMVALQPPHIVQATLTKVRDPDAPADD